jgi:replication factor A1
VFRCPDCNRVLQKNMCRLHGEKTGVPDLRTKAIIDDGSGAINAILNRDITEKLLGKSLDKCMKEAKKAMDQGIIKDQLFDRLVAMPVCVSGNVMSDDFGLMLIATSTEFLKGDTQADARKMLEEVNQ